VHLEIEFRTRFGVPALKILPDHDQRHQHDLNYVADEQISDERRKRIESRPMQRGNLGGEEIVSRPHNSPARYNHEEADGSHFVSDGDGRAVESFQTLFVNRIHVPRYSLL